MLILSGRTVRYARQPPDDGHGHYPFGGLIVQCKAAMPTLEFKGKPLVYAHHLTVPSRTLEVDAEKSLPLKPPPHRFG